MDGTANGGETTRQPADPKSLGEFNNELEILGLGRIGEETFHAIRRSVPKESLVEALNSARKGDEGSLEYLSGLFAPSTDVHTPPLKGPTPAPQGCAPTEREERKRESVHVYGGKAALCFEADRTPGSSPTVALDAALSVGQRSYDWKGKIRLQLTRSELPAVTAVFLGLIPSFEGTGHGKAKDKGFSLEDQGENIFFRVFKKGEGVRAVPVSPGDAFEVSSLLVRQLLRAHPWMRGIDDVVTLLRMVLVPRMGIGGGEKQRPKA